MKYCYQKKDHVFLAIKLTPKSAKDAINGVAVDQYENEYLAIKVRALPEKGKANIALISFLAKKLQIPKTCMELTAGHTSSYKTIRIDKDLKTLQTKILEHF